jgi:hypothetical protein
LLRLRILLPVPVLLHLHLLLRRLLPLPLLHHLLLLLLPLLLPLLRNMRPPLGLKPAGWPIFHQVCQRVQRHGELLPLMLRSRCLAHALRLRRPPQRLRCAQPLPQLAQRVQQQRLQPRLEPPIRSKQRRAELRQARGEGAAGADGGQPLQRAAQHAGDARWDIQDPGRKLCAAGPPGQPPQPRLHHRGVQRTQ